MGRYVVVYLATLLTVAVMDGVWLGVVAKGWYQNGIGHLMAPKPNLAAAAAFYLIYPIGLMVFAVWPSGGEWTKAIWVGALFGFFAYGTYDATNLAILRDWPVGLSFLDTAWGALVSAVAATSGAFAYRWMNS